jgi:hypothetical protein
MLFSPLPYIRRYLRKKLGETVYDGIYQGMKWKELTATDCYETKLMGIYEKELYPVIECITQKPLHSLCIIGTAEGYHALGLARLTGLSPCCFERDEKCNENLHLLSSLNEVPIKENGQFTSKTTLELAPGLILMDIEGEEINVLTKDRLSAWKDHHVIVEVHASSIKEKIKERSKTDFKTDFVPVQRRTVDDYPLTIPFKWLLRRWWHVPVQEWRSDSIGWLILWPHSEGGSKG